MMVPENPTTSVTALSPELLWILVVAFVIAFLLAFSVGANDVSNSFGTSVGSKVLTVTQACILATFFEVAGASLLGYSVCDTFRKNMYDVNLYKDTQKELMLGALSCLIGSAFWNIIATALKMPISGTHSIVGATVGFNLVLRGWSSIKWMKLLYIVASWFASPLLAGVISSIIYVIISKTVIKRVNPLKNGLKALPLFYGATIFINIASVVINGPEVFSLNKLPWYGGLSISLLIAGIVMCIVGLLYVPKLKRKITDEIILQSQNKKNQPVYVRETRLNQPTIRQNEPHGQDNVAFKCPESLIKSSSMDSKLEKPKRSELTLSPNELIKGTSEESKTKPPIAPKPAFLLKRQAAHQDSQPLDEIDLSGDEVRVVSSSWTTKVDSTTKKIDLESNKDKPGMISGERLEVFRLLSVLQILTACFASFAHGSNDVSNAVAPLIPIWNIAAYGMEDTTRTTQIWILLFGGIGICTGLWAWGRAVMGTVGEGLTKLTPSKGFSIELGAAISVLTASKLGLPISTTHCKVGSVVIVGLISSKFCSKDRLMVNEDVKNWKTGEDESGDEDEEDLVDWKLFGNIALTWIVTVPFAAGVSALIMLLLKWLVL